MFLRTEILPEKTFAGKRVEMSFADNKTFSLWSNFMPLRARINNIVGGDLYSIEVYPNGFFANFNPQNNFEKWAAVEISAGSEVPEGIEKLQCPGGLYAVFLHKGPASDGSKTYNHIFTEWLPDSGCLIDTRPHLAVMGEKYKNDDKDSEEEIWIPVR